MAIYHFSAQVVKRSSGASAVAGAAYRAGDELFDERTAELKDYKNKSGVVHSEILMPENAPAAFADRGTLWNAVEAAEKRTDSQLAREINVAIPNELTRDQGIDLVRNFVTEQMVNLGMIADVNHHEAHSKKDMNNHAHIMLTLRDVGPDGFGLKNRDWNDKAIVEKWRKEWANHANKALEAAGHDARIDHRSFKDQGITDLQPTVHLGPSAHALEQRGVKTVPGEINRAAAEHNAEILQLAETQAEIRVLQEEKALRDSYQGETTGDKPGFVKTLDLAFVKDAETGQFIWKNQFEQNEKRIVAFVEHVDKITAHSNNKTAIKAMAQASVEKFGQNFKVNGGEDFKREMWIQGSLLGASVNGYEPTAKDLDDLQKRADEYKSQYKKDIVFDSKVEEMLLLRYAESLKEGQKLAVNERNPQPEEREIKPELEEVKNDTRNNGRTFEADDFKKPGLNAFKQRGAPQDSLRTLSELRLDAGIRKGNKGILPGHERLNIQQRREEPAEQLRRNVHRSIDPKPVPTVNKPNKPSKPIGLAGMVSAHRDKERVVKPRSEPVNQSDIDRRIVMAESALSIQQKEVERINLDRSDAAEIQRDNEKRLNQLRRQEIDRNVIKPMAFKEVMGDKLINEFEGLAKKIELKKRTLDQAVFFQKIGLKKEIKKLEVRREEINSEIKPKWPKIKALIDETENIMKRERDNEINILKREIESLKSNDQNLKDALDYAEKQRAAARAELDNLLPPEPERDNDYDYER